MSIIKAEPMALCQTFFLCLLGLDIIKTGMPLNALSQKYFLKKGYEKNREILFHISLYSHQYKVLKHFMTLAGVARPLCLCLTSILIALNVCLLPSMHAAPPTIS